MNQRKDARRYARKGQSAIQGEKFESAIVYYSRALKLNKNKSHSLFGMAVALAERERCKEASILYKRVVAMDPNNSAAYYNLAFVLDMLGKIDESIEMYKEAIRLDPNDVDGYKNLAILLTSKGKCEEAREHYSKVLELKPSDIFLVSNGLGCLYFIQGMFAKASEEFQKSIALDEKFTHAYCNMSLILFCEKKVEEAEKYFQDGMKTLENEGNKLKTIKEMMVSYTDHRTRLEAELNSSGMVNEEQRTLFGIMIDGLTKMIDLLTPHLEK